MKKYAHNAPKMLARYNFSHGQIQSVRVNRNEGTSVSMPGVKA